MTLTLRYSEPLVRKAVHQFWWRTTGWRFVLALALVLGSFIAMLVGGDRSWFVGLLGAVVLLAVAFASALYVVHYRGSLGRLRRMRIPQATLQLSPEGLRVSSDVGALELEWRAVTAVWSFRECMLIFLSPAQFMIIPSSDLDHAAAQLILDKARAHGARVA